MTARQQIRVGRLGKERSPIDAQAAPTVGETLQAARERKGVDLYRAERDTKIRARHLAALESGDYTELPGSVYTKGFLRNYALYLGLDPEELLTRWRDEQDFGRGGEPVAVTAPPQPLAEPRRGFTFTPGVVIAGILSVVVLLFAGYIGLQLVRFAQVPAITLEGDRVIRLPEDATKHILRGTAGARAVINIKGPDGAIIQSASADENGAWVSEVGVSKGRNDFTLIARDPDTARDSEPLEVIVTVAVPATPSPAIIAGASPPSGASPPPVASPPPGTTAPPLATPGPVATAPSTLAPGTTSTPQPAITPAPIAAAALLAVNEPQEGATVENRSLTVRGTSDAAEVTVEAVWAGEGAKPRGGGNQTLRVRNGAFDGRVSLPAGRWAITITTASREGVTPSTATRAVEVRHTGLFVTVEARSGSAWIQVWVDGEIAETGHTFRKGESEAFTAKRSVVVSSGNAGATYVVINGEPYGAIGADGQIATMQFTKGKEPRPLS